MRMDSGPLYMAMHMRDIDMFRLYLPNLHHIQGLNDSHDIQSIVLKVANWCYDNHFMLGLEECLSTGLSAAFADEAGENLILAKAAGTKRNNVVSLLLFHGADPDRLNIHGRSALLEAAIANNVEGIDLLHQAKCNLDIKDPGQFTPLLSAIWGGATEACLRLIELGADITPPPTFSFSCLEEFARASGHEECARKIEEALADREAKDLGQNTQHVKSAVTRRNL
jgi:ankyrin repeat protein